MSITFKEIPEGATRLYVDYWACGDYCECRHMKIRVEFANGGSNQLWEGQYFNSDDVDEDNIKSLKKELQVACDYYGVPVNLESDSYWDWEGERIL
jgi:hypothetical protein